MPYTIDALGIVACPRAELSEPDLLAPFILSRIAGDLPPGLPRGQADALQGKRCDIALRVDFLSEVFVETDLPHSPTGKLLKRVLADRVNAAPPA